MEFDEDDIRLPLQNVLNELSSPEIRFDYTTYIDKVESQFPSGYAENDDIHKLKSLQTRLLNEIDQDMGQQLTAASWKSFRGRFRSARPTLLPISSLTKRSSR